MSMAMEGVDDYQGRNETFLTWLHRSGVQMSSKISLVDIRAQGRGRGVIEQTQSAESSVYGELYTTFLTFATALQDIAVDEVIFSIPRSATLNLDNFLKNFSYDIIRRHVSEEEFLEQPNWISLTIAVMTEMSREDSFWAPYLSILPIELDSLIFWTPEELVELQGSAVTSKIGRNDAEEKYHQIISALPIPDNNVANFHKVASIIMAYAFDIPDEDTEGTGEGDDGLEDDLDEKTTLTMIPLADMLNANADQNNVRLVSDGELLEMKAIKPIKPGEEIYNDYGDLPRADLLRRYGYISDHYAVFDVAEISAEFVLSAFKHSRLVDRQMRFFGNLEDAELQARIDLAIREDVYETSYDLSHAGSGTPCIPDEFVALIYLLLIDAPTLDAITSAQSNLPSRRRFLATTEVGNVIKQLLLEREQSYGTSLEQDEDLLKASRIAHRRMMAIKVRLGEKIIIREALLEARDFHGDDTNIRTATKRSRDEDSSDGSTKLAKR